MNINAIIHEQIDWDGTAKAFQLQASQSIGDLWVAFPTDYSGERNAPFYFLDKEYESIYLSKTANCRQIKLSDKNFYQRGEDYIFETKWQRVPTERQSLTYYALYLPEYAIPTEIFVTDTRDANKQFSKNVFRDDEKSRFVIYVECTSKFGQFNFNIYCRFHFDKNIFSTSKYHDNKTVDFYAHHEEWKWLISKDEIEQVEQFFITNHFYQMGDQYNVNQAGAVGPNSSAVNNTFNQLNNSLPADTNYEELANELKELRQALLARASNPKHYTAIGEIAQAEEAAKVKNGAKVINSLLSAGKWALDVAKEIGKDVLAEVIKKQIGT